MSILPVQGSPAVSQVRNQAPAAAASHQQASVSVLPEDRVTLSPAALAKSSGGDTDHDHDSK